MEKTRAFICIDFPDEVIKEVARVQEMMAKTLFTGKLTELENLHITLKFLGEIDQDTIEKIKSSLKRIKFPELDLKLAYAGTFSKRKNPSIVWIKVAGNVEGLQKEIDSALKEVFPEEKRFMSHLTIARIKYVKDQEWFKDYIKKIRVRPIRFNVSEFKLKSSDLRPDGPIYTTIEEYALQKD